MSECKYLSKVCVWIKLICSPIAACHSEVASNLQPSHIVDYEKVKDLANYPEKLLIDVREASELVAEGKISFSINIPCRIPWKSLACFYRFVFQQTLSKKPWNLIRRRFTTSSDVKSRRRKRKWSFIVKVETEVEEQLSWHCRWDSLSEINDYILFRYDHCVDSNVFRAKSYKGSWLDWSKHEGVNKWFASQLFFLNTK